MTEAEQNRLIIEHTNLIALVAAEFRGRDIEFEELCSIGGLALTNAARSFDDCKAKFKTWANTKIRSAMMEAVRGEVGEWYPKDDDPAFSPLEGDKLERIFEWDPWGRRGNAEAICERWTELDATPEELLGMYQEIGHKHDRFAGAFISLNHIERKLVRAVYLDNPPMSLADAARDIGISYWRAVRSLRKALKIMREVISRMEVNEKPALAPA